MNIDLIEAWRKDAMCGIWKERKERRSAKAFYQYSHRGMKLIPFFRWTIGVRSFS